MVRIILVLYLVRLWVFVLLMFWLVFVIRVMCLLRLNMFYFFDFVCNGWFKFWVDFNWCRIWNKYFCCMVVVYKVYEWGGRELRFWL